MEQTKKKIWEKPALEILKVSDTKSDWQFTQTDEFWKRTVINLS